MTRDGLKAGTLLCYLFLACIFLFALGSRDAAFPLEALPRGPEEANFKDRLTFQLVTGSLFSTKFSDTHVHTLDYWQTNFRLGCLLNKPGSTPSLLRGSFEALLEITGSVIYKGPGTYLVGATALLRYNFVQPSARFIPYLQAGAGFVYNDAYQEQNQDGIGQSIEFTPQASLGFRYLIRPNWSLDGEFMYHHISNANLAPRNDGVNSLGGFIGVTYFFNPRR